MIDHMTISDVCYMIDHELHMNCTCTTLRPAECQRQSRSCASVSQDHLFILFTAKLIYSSQGQLLPTKHDDISVLGVASLFDLVLKPVAISHDGVLVTSKHTEPFLLHVDVLYANMADGNHGGGKLVIQVKDRLQERTQRSKAMDRRE